MKWYIKVLKNYFNFSGRARRKEYWMFFLFNMLFIILAMILDNLLGLTIEPAMYGWIYVIYALAVLFPSWAVVVRRLHDIGKSGWWILIGLIPIVGGIILLVWFCTEGDAGENEYGLDPKQVEE